MKTITRIVLAVVICSAWSCSSTDETPAPPPPGIPEPAASLSLNEIKSRYGNKIDQDNTFAFDLLRQTARVGGKENIFLSPLSASMALSMAVNGANGDTRDEMLNALRVSGYSVDQINEYARNLRAGLVNVDPETEFTIANSIWYREGFPVESTFVQANRDNYRAEVNAADFKDPNTLKRINDWVYSYTNGKIEKILEKIPEDAMTYLINAVYFNGSWVQPFQKEATKNEEFLSSKGKTSRVPTMKQTSDFNYSTDDQAAYLELAYGDKAFNMVLILPREGKTVAQVTDHLNNQTWNTALSGMEQTLVALSLPRFHFESEFLLNEKILPAMGMNKAFTTQADFSGLSSSFSTYISFVLHKTYISVNEEGSEAAAATNIGNIATSPGPGYEPPKPVPFTVDKPFLFAIREKSTGAILFIGRVGEI